MYSHARCPSRKMSQTAHQRKDYIVLVHMMATHTAFDYKLVARVLGLSAMFTFIFLQPVFLCTESARCLERHCSHFLLIGIDGLVHYKTNRLRSYRSLNMRTTPPNNDFTALFIREAKWPSTSSGSTVSIFSRAKTTMPTCLHCAAIRIIISFLAVPID